MKVKNGITLIMLLLLACLAAQSFAQPKLEDLKNLWALEAKINNPTVVGDYLVFIVDFNRVYQSNELMAKLDEEFLYIRPGSIQQLALAGDWARRDKKEVKQDPVGLAWKFPKEQGQPGPRLMNQVEPGIWVLVVVKNELLSRLYHYKFLATTDAGELWTADPFCAMPREKSKFGNSQFFVP